MMDYHHNEPCSRCGGAFVIDPDDPGTRRRPRWRCAGCGSAPRIVIPPGMTDAQNDIELGVGFGDFTEEEADAMRAEHRARQAAKEGK